MHLRQEIETDRCTLGGPDQSNRTLNELKKSNSEIIIIFCYFFLFVDFLTV